MVLRADLLLEGIFGGLTQLVPISSVRFWHCSMNFPCCAQMETPVLISSLCQPVGLLKTGPGISIRLEHSLTIGRFHIQPLTQVCCVEFTDLAYTASLMIHLWNNKLFVSFFVPLMFSFVRFFCVRIWKSSGV